MFGWNVDLGLDLGTCVTTIYRRGHGIVLSEPSLVAFSQRTGRPIAVGREAKVIADQASQEARVEQPLTAGAVADHEAAVEMIKSFFVSALGRRPLLMPRVLAAIAAGATPVEEAALVSAIRSAGARRVLLANKTLAGAIGAGLPMHDRVCRLVVDFGGGSTDLGVICQGTLLWGRSIRFGGQNLDEAVRKLVRARYGLSVTMGSAERLKLKAGSVVPGAPQSEIAMNGQQVYGDLFRNLAVSFDGIPDLLARAIMPVIEEIKWAIAELPPEQRIDIQAGGITLIGGSARLYGLPEAMASKLGLPVHLAREPATAVAIGLGAMLDDPTKLSPEGRRYGEPPAHLPRPR